MLAPVLVEAQCLVSCMHLAVGETLDLIRDLASPVARTSHIGNNGAHNWAWLALGGNTYLQQWDHSLYGVDDIFVPWTMLGDHGVVEASYDPWGAPHPAAAGQHVTAVLRDREPKYVRHLCYGVFAEHGGRDLVAEHCRVAARLSARLNGSLAVSTATEIQAMRDLLSRAMVDLCRTRRLHLLVKRWVRRSRRGALVALKLRGVEYHGAGEVALHTLDSMQMFRGPVSGLIELLFAGMAGVAERLASGRVPSFQHYPWINGSALYLLRAMREHDLDPRQESFWHAGGSTSPFYLHQDEVSGELAKLRDALAGLGYLPGALQIQLIPTLSAQLFATGPRSLAVLDCLLATWQELLRKQGAAALQVLERFAGGGNPRLLARELCATLGPAALAELRRRMEEFNELDAHRLPVAYAPGCDHPTYNKYGIAQRRLAAATPLFSARLRALRWGEAELLVKVLAEIAIERAG